MDNDGVGDGKEGGRGIQGALEVTVMPRAEEHDSYAEPHTA